MQKKLDKLKSFDLILQYVDGFPTIVVTLPERWVVENMVEDIEVVKHTQKPHSFIFYSNNLGFNQIIDSIDLIVEYNYEQEAKEKLFQKATTDLVTFFTEHTLKELETLQFTVSDQPKLVFTKPNTTKFIGSDKKITPPPKEIIKPEPTKVEVKETPLPTQQSEVKKNTINSELQGEIDLISKAKETLAKRKKDDPPFEDFKSPDTCNCGPDDFCPVCANEKGF